MERDLESAEWQAEVETEAAMIVSDQFLTPKSVVSLSSIAGS
jgi:hypothetical protein